VRLLFRSPATPTGEPSDGPGAGVEVDPLDAYDEPRTAPAGRPWVIVDMIASIDGATALAGRSGGLGGPADKAVFRALRAVPDVVLVGAGTARIEAYGAVRLDDEVRARRQARGQAPVPRLALVSGRLDLDPDAAMFADAAEPPVVLTTEVSLAERGGRFEGRAEVVAAGTDSVDLGRGLAHLHGTGARVVLVEGGPHLNGQLVAAGLVDEWCQSLAPMLVAGESVRVAHGPEPVEPLRLELHRVLEEDGYLFGTWRRADRPPPTG
jgi:riboflavin biosynthesis pyrimidine reductase